MPRSSMKMSDAVGVEATERDTGAWWRGRANAVRAAGTKEADAMSSSIVIRGERRGLLVVCVCDMAWGKRDLVRKCRKCLATLA